MFYWKTCIRLSVLGICFFFVTSCAEVELLVHTTKQLSRETETDTDTKPYDQGQPVPAGYKVGKPYKISGVWYYPYHDPNYNKTGIASWYGEQFHGRQTANGEIFDMNTVTAAHKTLALPSIARVTNIENGRTLLVRVNDRGPFVNGRIIDLSRRSAQLLGVYRKGTAQVSVEFIELASLKSIASKDSAYGLAKTSNNLSTPVNNNTYSNKISEVELVTENLDNIILEPIELDALPQSATNSKEVYEPDISDREQTYIQLGAFTRKENAIRLKNKISTSYSTHITHLIKNGKDIYRVRVGPLTSALEIEKALIELSNGGFSLSSLIIVK